MLIHDSGYKSRIFFLFNRNIVALFYNVTYIAFMNSTWFIAVANKAARYYNVVSNKEKMVLVTRM